MIILTMMMVSSLFYVKLQFVIKLSQSLAFKILCILLSHSFNHKCRKKIENVLQYNDSDLRDIKSKYCALEFPVRVIIIYSKKAVILQASQVHDYLSIEKRNLPPDCLLSYFPANQWCTTWYF